MDLPPDSDCEDIVMTDPTDSELPPLDFSSNEGLLGLSQENSPG